MLRRRLRFGRPQEWAIAEALLIGVLAGASAYLLKIGAEGLSQLRSPGLLPGWLYPVVGGLLGGLAGLMVQQLAPEAEGSGVPQLQAALRQSGGTLGWRVALVKLLSTVLVNGSGMPLGRQGPTVMVGASLATEFSRRIPTSPEYRRQLIAAGAAAGLAAGFHAPLAGVMLVLEQLLRDVSGLTLGTAILASFSGSVVSGLLGGEGLVFASGILAQSSPLTPVELPLVALIGLLAGVLAAAFNRSLQVSRQRLDDWLPSLPWVRTAIAGALCALTLALLPGELRQILDHPFVVTIPRDWEIALATLAVNFLMTLVAASSGASGGLFAPALVLGSSLGLTLSLGLIDLQQLLGWSLLRSPATYALAGMAAFFAGLNRGPITAIVIVFEMTRDFTLVLPLMVASGVAYSVAMALLPGQTPAATVAAETGSGLAASLQLPARAVMRSPVETLSSYLPLGEVRRVFTRSSHRGFPVLEGDRLVGLISQSDLDAYVPGDDDHLPLAAVMTPRPVTVGPDEVLGRVLYLLSRHQISRLPVVNGDRLLGIITRADIIRAEAEQLEGRWLTAAPQRQPTRLIFRSQAPGRATLRLLLVLAGPVDLNPLLPFAHRRRWQIDCLLPLLLPERADLCGAAAPRQWRRWLRRQEREGRRWSVPLHSQIRVAHSLPTAVLAALEPLAGDPLLVACCWPQPPQLLVELRAQLKRPLLLLSGTGWSPHEDTGIDLAQLAGQVSWCRRSQSDFLEDDTQDWLDQATNLRLLLWDWTD